jgi:hypothetical protein
MTDRPIEILEWKPVRKGPLRGWATLKIERMHQKIHDVGIFEQDGKRWANLPSKPMIGRDGMVLKDTAGKTRYQPTIEWTDKETIERFNAAVVQELLTRFPGAFD